MDIGSIIVSDITKRVVRSILSISSVFPLREKDISEKISKHLEFVASWSSSVHSLGMTKPHDIEKYTIGLGIEKTPRRFRPLNQDEPLIWEENLILDKLNYVILGDPGSGKTTTLQRICRIFLCKGPISEEDQYNYPIVIRLRQIPLGGSIILELANLLGFPIDELQSVNTKKEKDSISAKQKLFDIINDTRPVIFLDGVDEISSNDRVSLESEIIDIGHSLVGAKVIATCRSGDYARTLVGYNIVEISPLDDRQVRFISEIWAENPSQFMLELEQCLYKDLVDRPLFLIQLILVYNITKNLPARPSDVYRRIITLVLEKWDQDRGISRQSRYANFDVDQKRDFLSAMSFNLTYKSKKKIFQYDDFSQTYRQIAQGFNLPINECDKVVSEIESHTGILVVSSFDNFEFSHLSIQEYLAADYIVRSGMIDHIKLYLKEYPAPVAIAVAISANPSQFFSNLILLSNRYFDIRLFSKDVILPFLSRVIAERPRFELNMYFGLAILKIMNDINFNYKVKSPYVIHFVENIISLRSMCSALDLFYIDAESERGFAKVGDAISWIRSQGFVILRVRGDLPQDPNYIIPSPISINIDVMRSVFAMRDEAMEMKVSDGKLLKVDVGEI